MSDLVKGFGRLRTKVSHAGTRWPGRLGYGDLRFRVVWRGEGDQKVEKTYDWKADFEMPNIIDFEEDEEFDVDSFVQLIERIV